MWRKIRDAIGEYRKKREVVISHSHQINRRQWIEKKAGERESTKKRERKDQANLRRADDLFSHKLYSRFIVQEDEEKKDKNQRYALKMIRYPT